MRNFIAVTLIAISLPLHAESENVRVALSSLDPALQVQVAKGLDQLISQVPAGATPQEIVEAIAQISGPGADPVQIRAAEDAIAALSDPEQAASVVADLRKVPGSGRRVAQSLADLAANYSSKEDRAAVSAAAAQARQDGKLASFFDGGEEGNETAALSFEQYADRKFGGNADVKKLAKSVFVDLTESKAQPFAGRAKKVADALAVLARTDAEKKSVLLTGELGIGRTALIEHIAAGVKSGTYVLNAKILELDLPKLASLYNKAEANGVAPFEAFFSSILPQLSADAVIVVRNAESLIADGGERILQRFEKPMQRAGQRFIFTLESDAALPKGHFLRKYAQKIELTRPDEQEAMQMLLARKDLWEASSGVKIQDAAIVELVRSSKEFLKKLHPQELIDNMERALSMRSTTSQRNAAKVRISDVYSQLSLTAAKFRRTQSSRDYNKVIELAQELDVKQALLKTEMAPELSPLDVRRALAEAYPDKANVILSDKDFRARLLEAIPLIDGRIVGQTAAKKAVNAVLRTTANGLASDTRPLGSFLFLGPSGTGKTEIMRAVAEGYLGDEKKITRFDMTEYQEPHTVAQLKGSPPGYAGYEAGGQLTNKIQENAEAVVLFDEMEKANKNILDILLGVLDDGRMTDGKGVLTDFTRSIIGMTSNVGSALIEQMTAEGRPFEEIETAVMALLRKEFRPEFLNRINKIVIFSPLDRDAVYGIGKLLLKKEVAKSLARNDNELAPLDAATEDAVLKSMLDHGGFDPKKGGRAMRDQTDALKEQIGERLAGQQGLSVSVGINNDQITVDTKPRVIAEPPKNDLPPGKLGEWTRQILDGKLADVSPAGLKTAYDALYGRVAAPAAMKPAKTAPAAPPAPAKTVKKAEAEPTKTEADLARFDADTKKLKEMLDKLGLPRPRK